MRGGKDEGRVWLGDWVAGLLRKPSWLAIEAVRSSDSEYSRSVVVVVVVVMAELRLRSECLQFLDEAQLWARNFEFNPWRGCVRRVQSGSSGEPEP